MGTVIPAQAGIQASRWHLRPFIVEPSVGVKPTFAEPKESVDPSRLRSAIREGRKLKLRYRSEAGEETERTVWPVILGYAETTRMLVAWCELRQGFRHFRTDRMVEVETLAETIGLRPGELRDPALADADDKSMSRTDNRAKEPAGPPMCLRPAPGSPVGT